jgi:hypothetical protein
MVTTELDCGLEMGGKSLLDILDVLEPLIASLCPGA